MLNHTELPKCLCAFDTPAGSGTLNKLFLLPGTWASPLSASLELLLILQPPSWDFTSPRSFPGCLINRAGSHSTSSLQRVTIITPHRNCLLACRSACPRLSALESWAVVWSRLFPIPCLWWQAPHRHLLNWDVVNWAYETIGSIYVQESFL